MSPEPQVEEVPVGRIRPEPAQTQRPVRSRWFRIFIYAMLPVTLLLCVVPELVLMPLRLVLEFAFGWVRFLSLQLPHVRPSSAELVLSGIVLGLLTSVLHATARGMYGANGRWKFRWTLALLLVGGTAFAVGTAVASIGRNSVLLSQGPILRPVGGVWGAARRAQSLSNLRQIGIAIHGYHDTLGRFPAGSTFDEFGRPMHSWMTGLLPYLSGAPVGVDIRRDLPWTATENRTAFQTEIDVFVISRDIGTSVHTPDGYAATTYAANVHVMGPNRGLLLRDVTDGLSKTIAAGEVFTKLRAWGDPLNQRDPSLGINTSPDGFGGPWRNGCQVLLMDGSARFLSDNTAPAILRKLATPNGGEAITDDELP
jgi:hypothetical protein